MDMHCKPTDYGSFGKIALFAHASSDHHSFTKSACSV